MKQKGTESCIKLL